MTPLHLAVDGGNSKTDAVLFDSLGRVVARRSGPGSGGGPADVARVVRALAERLAEVEQGGRPPAPFPPDLSGIATVVCAVAGLDFVADAVLFDDALAAVFPAARIRTLNDVEALLSAHDPSGHGLVLVSGAGMNAVARGPACVARVPALDWISGDWGGGDAIGREAVRVANRAADGRGPSTSLAGAVLDRFGQADFVELAHVLRYGPEEAARVADLAPVVFEHAESGDEVAALIVARAVAELLALARVVSARAWTGETPAAGTPALLAGGTFQAPPLRDPVVAGLVADGFDAQRFGAAPVLGPTHEAVALAGLDPAVLPALDRALTLA